ncbi:MAG: hypothetical protein KAJ90_07115 [Desulfobacterales bacterium]|nr:hypothetical protein [Desulfobacterales bacterium]
MNKEEVYDNEISPLMNKIISICKEHKISTLCSFELPIEKDPDLVCTTALIGKEYESSDNLNSALGIIYR